jgi:cobalt-zinc-cadmium efflux system membrane fusion protein
MCPWCDPSLIESLGFCHGHGVPEAFCYLCNPALIPAFKAVGDWCAGHDRPESQCYICNPHLDPANKETSAAQTPQGATTYFDMPYVSRTQQPPSVYCSKQDLIIRFDDPEVAADAGLEYATVESRRISKTIECNAEIVYDGNRFAHIAAQVPGIITEVHRDFGDAVETGTPLVTITSTHLGAAKAAYLQASAAVELWEQNHARETDLLERGVSTESDLLEAKSRLTESRISLSETKQALLSFGLTEKQIEHVRRREETSARYVVTAPFSGTVVDRHATVGELVDPSMQIFAVADASRMWALIDVFEADLREVAVGQPVVLRVEGLRGEPIAGHIAWVSTQLDPQTRTLQARVELDNDRGLLRANMFARASVTVSSPSATLVVPTTSVQWEGCCNVVFVKESDTVFEPRKVHLGIGTGTLYQVLSGISEGDTVVTQGSFLLKTEILKGSIGTGCCEINPGA